MAGTSGPGSYGTFIFLDTGLVCYLLGIPDPESLERHPLRGAVFESFVASELLKAFENRVREAPLYHWRDATGHEIDIILEMGDQLVPVEVKSGLTVVPETLDTLRWWAGIEENPNERGVLIHGGEVSWETGGMTVLPWFVRSICPWRAASCARRPGRMRWSPQWTSAHRPR